MNEREIEIEKERERESETARRREKKQRTVGQKQEHASKMDENRNQQIVRLHSLV